MKTEKKQRIVKGLHVTFSDSKATVKNCLNKKVLADAVEQIAIENNKKALELRDKGEMAKAIDALTRNTAYLEFNGRVLDSEKLKTYAGENEIDADNLDSYNWTRQRKSMRENQTKRSMQR
jgi:hypothetical protein